MKVGLVLEGGAKRGAFTTGALEALKDRREKWDYVVGVSAGGGSAFNYLSNDNYRTMKLIDPGKGNEYISFGNLVKTGKYVNLDKMVYEYSYNQFPVDFPSYYDCKVEDEYVALCCETGKPVYFHEKQDEQRLLKIIKATCSIPILCKPVEIEGKHYLDGSVVDAIPYERALEKCDKVVVIVTRTAETKPTNYARFRAVLKLLYKKYPETLECLMHRTERYHEQLLGLEEKVKEGKVFLLRPEFNLKKFESDKGKLDEFYRHGYDLMKSREAELKEFLGE